MRCVIQMLVLGFSEVRTASTAHCPETQALTVCTCIREKRGGEGGGGGGGVLLRLREHVH